MQRHASEQTGEAAVTVLHLPTDDLKGRIIGREGRNIRALEAATGIDVIVDETPEAVVLSGFDPVRREVAKVALERLFADGRIHPARIEEVVAKSRAEIADRLREEGEAACQEVGITGVHPELVKLLGTLRYRSAYGANVLAHSKDTAAVAGHDRRRDRLRRPGGPRDRPLPRHRPRRGAARRGLARHHRRRDPGPAGPAGARSSTRSGPITTTRSRGPSVPSC